MHADRSTALTLRRFVRCRAAALTLGAVLLAGFAPAPSLAAPKSSPGTVAAATSTSLIVDQQVVTHQSSVSSTISAPALTTGRTGDLLLVFLTSGGPSTARQTFSAVSGGGLSWKLRQRANAQRGTSEVWQAVAPTTVRNLVVTATRGAAASTGSMVVTAIAGADLTANGASRAASGASGAAGLGLTPTRVGSWVWAAGNDGTRAAARAVGTGQTMVDQYLTRTRTYWVQRQSAPASTLSSTMINTTAPSDDRWNLAAVEVLPAVAGSGSDTTAPKISNPKVSGVGSGGVTVGWTTDEAASSQVAYGTTSSYGATTPLDTTRTTSHSQTLSGLAAGTTYHYQLRSSDAAGNTATSADATFSTAASTTPTSPPSAQPGFDPGNPDGTAPVPAGMGLEDASRPDHVVGTGTAASCTAAALRSAVASGGVVTFSCGSAPTTITLDQTLKIPNGVGRLVIDGGGLITLSGAKANRIMYIDTCDTSLGSVFGNCLYAPAGPQVTVQNLTFADGNASNAGYVSPGDTTQGSNGGGAIFALGGRLKVVRSVFVRNSCASSGPDLGGGAIRVLAQHSSTPNDLDNSWAARNQDPAVIVQSTFGGSDGQGNSCSNGGAISSLRSSITMINSLVSYNSAVGCCSNPAKSGTPGGGSGGASYSDGDSYNLTITGSDIEHNSAKAGGSAIFYVSNDNTGHLSVRDSVSRNNGYSLYQGGDQHFQNYPGIFYLGDGAPDFTGSTIA